ncbi:hypothetical protein D046_6578B, partial [Vibrio parahaemolyticus V-223/04]
GIRIVDNYNSLICWPLPLLKSAR